MKSALLVLSLVVFIVGCESGQIGKREIGATAGAGLGAGLGAIIGHATNNTGAGIAIGAGVGALTGGVLGNEMDRQDAQSAERDRRLDEQDRQLAENRRLIQALRARGTDVRESDRGVVVNLPDVLFEFNQARLTSSALRTVADIAEVVRNAPERQVAVEGHTDSIGSVGYNERLSTARARSVADQLVSSGVSRRRLSVRGLGERDPVASNRTDAGRARNRRVEVIIENR